MKCISFLSQHTHSVFQPSGGKFFAICFFTPIRYIVKTNGMRANFAFFCLFIRAALRVSVLTFSMASSISKACNALASFEYLLCNNENPSLIVKIKCSTYMEIALFKPVSEHFQHRKRAYPIIGVSPKNTIFCGTT